jgi:Flp pilus assembly pilin Flp
LLDLFKAYAASYAAKIKREEGQAIVEYALVIGGVSLVLIGILVGSGLAGQFTTLVGRIATGMGNTVAP